MTTGRKRTHIMRDGTRIKISDMQDSHLINTILLFRRNVQEGVRAVSIMRAVDAEDICVDVDYFRGSDALEILDIASYLREAKRRGLSI